MAEGGGNTAVGDALHLAKLCAKVYLVHRRDALRAPAVYQTALADAGVEIVWNARPAALLRGATRERVSVWDKARGAGGLARDGRAGSGGKGRGGRAGAERLSPQGAA